MKTSRYYLLMIVAIISILCCGCNQTPAHKYSPYVEQPHISCVGTISDENLNTIHAPEADISLFFLTNSHMWSINKSNTVYQTNLHTGESSKIGEYSFGRSLLQFSQTEDGTIWSSFSAGDILNKETAYLVAFDEKWAKYASLC